MGHCRAVLALLVAVLVVVDLVVEGGMGEGGAEMVAVVGWGWGRAILERFEFVTDEIAAREDRAWSNGPSGAQFEAFVRAFERFAGGTRSVSIRAAVDGLLFELVLDEGVHLHDGLEPILVDER